MLCVWAFSLIAASAPAQSKPTGSLVLKWQPAKLVNGSPVLFEFTAPARVESLTATWMGHSVSFFKPDSGKQWYALAGVPVETAPGSYPLQLSETFAGGKSAAVMKSVRVARAVYPKITVHVERKYTEPSPEQLREINADKQIKQTTFSTETPERLWAGSFVAPVSSPVSDIFGTARVFNQEVKSRHLGLDFAAPGGTPVHAVNRGTVILAQQLYFEGGCVVIDHGQGLLSLYLHLSDFKVKPGDQVEPGQLIGLSGSSGRATGPHLHLAIRWQGVYVDPATLLKLQTP